MKNIEKYYYAITDNLKSKSGENLGCAVFDIRHGNDDCGDTDCLECCLKNLEWLNSEYKVHVLTEEEKTIVESMIYVLQKIGCTVKNVTKYDNGRDKAYIGVNYTNEITGACGRMQVQ